MTIRLLPPAPSRDDPVNFSGKADALLGALDDFVDDCNALESSLTMVATTATSTTSLAIGTGSKSITTQTGKAWATGSWLYIVSAASVANYMQGQITAYDVVTGALAVNVSVASGSGTLASWVIGLAVPTTASANLSGGAAGTIPYQSAPGVTAQLAAGPAGNRVLQENGASAPSWVAPESMVAGADAAGANNFPRKSQVQALITAATPDASTSAKGLAELADSAETQTGTDAARIVTPKGLADTMLGGVGQTWQSFTEPARQALTTYTNSTGRPIVLAVEALATGAGQAVSVSPTVNGVALPTIILLSNAAGYTASCWVIVPNGSTYSVSVNAALGKWFELR